MLAPDIDRLWANAYFQMHNFLVCIITAKDKQLKPACCAGHAECWQGGRAKSLPWVTVIIWHQTPSSPQMAWELQEMIHIPQNPWLVGFYFLRKPEESYEPETIN